jgi:hypothetical protein
MNMVWRWAVVAAVAYVVGVICWSFSPAAGRAKYQDADAFATYGLVGMAAVGSAVGLGYFQGPFSPAPPPVRRPRRIRIGAA